ncbi:galactokinase [Actinokineospora diospyrosa]|uniref:Galactokinase n=1 Tax=Actinokineospora diospyrosa TaxID=103728 RepID=A0ABT1I4Q5_9PSEU|nr:galactokinase family protein [Actinokineospora diospyrosa]MCP2267596.1 galactokinase [Actinokineospora diospyrosa]
MTPADRAADRYRGLHGHAPVGVWSAPGRVNLIGEHTDYNNGLVLPFALPHRVAVAAAPRADGRISATTIGDDGVPQRAAAVPIAELAPGGVTGWAAYAYGVAWVLRAAGFTSGAELVITGDVPTGAGLSSSHALQCAVALALLGLAGVTPAAEGPTLPEVAEWVRRSENDFVGAPTGLLDQTAALRCVAGHALFLDIRSGAAEQIPFGAPVLVIDTRVRHALADSAYGERRRGCERAAELLGLPSLREIGPDADLHRLPGDLLPLVRHVVTENQRVLATVAALRAGTEIGPLLSASHASLREDYRVSCRELDVAVEAAEGAGALGARMTGGGFGGSAIAVVPPAAEEAVRAAVRAAFAEHSFTPPRLFTAAPSPGAGRDH